MTRAATGVEEEESPAEPSPEEQTVVLLQEIRDQLNNGSPSSPSAINPSLR
jgi:large conductance mechanosensitive channel